MKKIFLVCSLISILNVACAQRIQRRSPQQRAAKKTQILEKELHLTAGQDVKVKGIMLSQAIRIDSLRTNRRAAKRANRLVHQNILAQTDQRMYGILNPEQKKAYAVWLKSRRERKLAKKENAG